MGVPHELAGVVIRDQLRPDRRARPTSTRFLAEWRRIAEPCEGRGRMIYLDYQATTPVAPEVAKAMQPWIEEQVRQPAFAVALGPRGGGRDRGRAQAGREGDRPQGRQRRLHRQRDRGAQLGAQGHGREGAARGATGSSPSRPSMPPCSTRCEWLAGQGIDLTVLPVGAGRPARPRSARARARRPRAAGRGDAWSTTRSASSSRSPKSPTWRTRPAR